MKRKIVLIMALVSVMATVALADSLVGVTTRTGNDTAVWSQLGAPGDPISNPFTATSNGGVGITGSFDGGGNGQVMQEGNNWFGNFAVNDFLVWTNSPGQGPLTLSLSQGVSQIGAQIQADFFGSFTAMIQAFDSNGNLLGSFSEAGNSTGDEDNSAIYIGIQDLTGANIAKVTFSLTDCAQDCNDFAINQLSLTTGGGGGGVPEPASLMLLGSGLVGIANLARRRSRK
ncbi:MAG TPA: PEP-CTERM sorting domain-containing protein [Terriglobales bacterium]|jgi:hypothetical protein|nr:PEP-CTERM sorting domain-containing protein [Terriglobales bacterium]